MSQSFLLAAFSLSVLLAPFASAAVEEDPQEQAKSVEALVTDLQEADASVRIEAVEKLAERGAAARPAVAALVHASSDPEGEVRRAAIIALGRLALEPERTIPALVSALSDPSIVQETRMNGLAGFALAEFGRPAVPHLISALDSDSLSVRRGALAGLYRCGPLAKEAIDPLTGMLEEDDPETRTFVLNTLMPLGPGASSAIPAVTKMLDSDDFHTQYWACRVLGTIGPDAHTATDKLVILLSSGVTSVRRNAAAALGKIGPSIGAKGVQALTAALEDFNQPVKQNAVIALGQLKPVSKSAADVIEKLLQKSYHFSPRAHAARTLWLLRPESESAVIDALLRDLSEDNEPWLAAKFLAEHEFTEDIVPRIIPLLQSDRLWVRRYAAEVLGNIGPDTGQAKQALQPLLQDQVEEVRDAAAAALKKIDATTP